MSELKQSHTVRIAALGLACGWLPHSERRPKPPPGPSTSTKASRAERKTKRRHARKARRMNR